MSRKASEFQYKVMSLAYRGKEVFKPLGIGWIDEHVACVRVGAPCHAMFRQRPHDPSAPYDGYVEDGDTEESARAGLLPEAKPIPNYENWVPRGMAFDAVCSNYVYHNVTGANKQALLRETLRCLKKGGVFAIHDLMGKLRYGDMRAFCEGLRAEGYEDVRLVPMADGLFMRRAEALPLMLGGSYLLVGRK